jgi:hypothetical protein
MPVSNRRKIALAFVPLILAACGGALTPAAMPSTPVADTQAPVVAVSSRVSGDDLVLAAVASDDVGIASVHFLIDGNLARVEATRNGFGSWSLPVPLTSLSIGRHRIAAIAFDAADNSAQAAMVLTVQASTAGPDAVVTPGPRHGLGPAVLTAVAANDDRTSCITVFPGGHATGHAASSHFISTSRDRYTLSLNDQ